MMVGIVNRSLKEVIQLGWNTGYSSQIIKVKIHNGLVPELRRELFKVMDQSKEIGKYIIPFGGLNNSLEMSECYQQSQRR